MSAKSGGSVAALLMSGPLAAIPLMALFGVPTFAPVSTSTDEEADGILRRPQTVASEPTLTPDVPGLAATPSTTEPKAFVQNLAPTVIPDHTSRPINLSGLSDTAHPSHAAGSSFTNAAPQSAFVETPPTVNVLARETTSPRARTTPTTLTTIPAPANQSPTWENAAQKLQELGIDDYRLERGQNDNTYVFICQFPQATDSRIIRRFEAEASEPAIAVQSVLQRITDWQQQAVTH